MIFWIFWLTNGKLKHFWDDVSVFDGHTSEEDDDDDADDTVFVRLGGWPGVQPNGWPEAIAGAVAVWGQKPNLDTVTCQPAADNGRNGGTAARQEARGVPQVG